MPFEMAEIRYSIWAMIAFISEKQFRSKTRLFSLSRVGG